MKIIKIAFPLLILLSTHALASGPTVGAPAPQAILKTLDGVRVDTSELKGKVVILNFWATWCTYCHQELEDLAAYYREHKKNGLEVLAVSVDEVGDAAKVRERARSYPFPVAMRVESETSGYGRIWRMPLTFVIDRKGTLVRENWGSTPAVTREQLEAMVTPLLREQY